MLTGGALGSRWPAASADAGTNWRWMLPPLGDVSDHEVWIHEKGQHSGQTVEWENAFLGRTVPADALGPSAVLLRDRWLPNC